MTSSTNLHRGMMPADLYRLRWVSDAQIDPAGERVAFVVTTLDEQADDYHSAIWLATVGETAPADRAIVPGSPRQFTRGPRRDTAPRWSPDGRQLAFISQRDSDKPQLYVIPAGGGEPLRLTDLELGAANPVWSPDGGRIVVTAKVKTVEAKPSPGGTPPPRVITTLKYKLNAEGFTYDKRTHLFVVDIGLGVVRQLTEGDFDDSEPCWSPDGRRIAFVSARHDERDFDRHCDLFAIDVASGQEERLTEVPGSAGSPVWSPDGSSIAFLGYRGADEGPHNDRLFLLEPGGVPRCLTEALDRNLVGGQGGGLGPYWTEDGSALLVGIQDRGDVALLEIDAASGGVERRLDGKRTLSNVSLDRSGGKLAFVASSSLEPGEVYLRDEVGERAIGGLNADWLSDITLSNAEQLTISGPGGDGFDAWLMRPYGYEPGTTHPLLLNIHGGPFVQSGNGFLDEFQVQCGAGFGVLYGNYRGSSGYSEAFARAIVGEPALKETDDVLASLDQALATFSDIDGSRLGVLGGSYGGYLTSWIIGHDQRFAAACSERAINNRLSKAGTDDINTSRNYFRKEPWQDPDLYLRLSPLLYVEQMTTPLLILHSEEDLRCPMEQAEQLFAALKRLRRDVVFVRFPGENHELTRAGKPSHRVARFEILLDFFRTRLHPD